MLLSYYRTTITIIDNMKDKDFYSGFIRLQILYHAAGGRIFGLGKIEEL